MQMLLFISQNLKSSTLLPSVEQNVLAKWALEELESEKKWGKVFAESEDALDRLQMKHWRLIRKVKRSRWISTAYELKNNGTLLEMLCRTTDSN